MKAGRRVALSGLPFCQKVSRCVSFVRITENKYLVEIIQAVYSKKTYFFFTSNRSVKRPRADKDPQDYFMTNN